MTLRAMTSTVGLAAILLLCHNVAAQRRSKASKTTPASIPPETQTIEHEEFGPLGSDVTTVPVRVQDVVRSAIAHHPTIQQLLLDTEIAELAIGRQEAQFTTIFSASASGRVERVYNEFAEDAVDDLTPINTGALKTGLRGKIKSGAEYWLNTGGSRISQPGADSLLTRLTPRWDTEISARWVQPLRRGSGYAANQALVDRERLTVGLRESEGYQAVLAVSLHVVASYWALVLRREELAILETNVNEALTLKEIVNRRVTAGQDPASSLVQAASAVAERRLSVEAARTAVVDAELALLSESYLTRSGMMPLDAVPVPAEKFDEDQPSVSFQKELQTALKQRPEALRLKKEVALARLNSRIAANGKHIRLDVYAEAGILGLGGSSNVPPFDRNGDPQAPPTDLLLGGAVRSAVNLATFKAPYFEAGVMIEFPFDNSDAVNAAKQADLQIQRSLAQDVETQISLDVRAAIQRILISRQSLVAARESLRLAEENVASQKLRYQGGGGTLFDVIRSQDEVTRAKARIALTRAQQSVALAGLEAAKGTLLSKYGINIDLKNK